MTLSVELTNPFELLNITKLTNVQQLIVKCCENNYFEKYNNLAISASCGSGKTLCGIYVIYKYQIKTLIISTRNAVKDQWKTTLKHLYPTLKIYTNEKIKTNFDDYDVWILTPQFFNYKNRFETNEFIIHPQLIIYDEIHTMLSENFVNIIKYPYNQHQRKNWTKLPFMLSLSATYPKKNATLRRTFGGVIHPLNNEITTTPIYVYDIRNEQTERKRGKYDEKYEPLNQYETIKYLTDNIPNIKEKFNKTLKCLIMTQNIDTSVWTALYIQRKFNVNVLLVRTESSNSYLIKKEHKQDFDETITLEIFKKNVKDSDDVIYTKKYNTLINNVEVIVSTIQRMKEGFSVENITWGISTSFPWNSLTRVQMCGRYRRTTNNEIVSTSKRILYTRSGKIPSTLFVKGSFNKNGPKIKYDWDYERELFEKENIKYIDIL